MKALSIEIVMCPRCGGKAWWYIDEDRAECTRCGLVWWNILPK